MASTKKRFPAPANQPKDGKPAAAKAADGPLPVVQAKGGKTVQVQYKKENNHILGIGAHALAKGVNTLPAEVWADAQKHPSVQQLIKEGHLVDLTKPELASDDAPADESEDDGEDFDKDGTEGAKDGASA